MELDPIKAFDRKKQKGFVFECRFRNGVDCTEMRCLFCGWNPAEEQKRKDRMQRSRPDPEPEPEYVPTVFTERW